ncbi:fucolectin-like [Pseudorasbora parva]|uniref:fucolectin-like n=1 Tax=Pseudorasbora parva TaxID=51549 RepID=UPI00351DD536
MMISRMAVRVILFLTLFTGLCVAQSKVKDPPSCPCSCGPKSLAPGDAAVQSSTNETLKAESLAPGDAAVQSSTNETLKADDSTSLYVCVPRNLALKATAVQSSPVQHNAKNAVDGNRNSVLASDSCSQTEEEMSPWWRVDLGKTYEINRVSITNRGDGFAKKINDAQIRIGNSLINNGNDNPIATVVDFIPLGETKSFKFRPVMGRYVNIFIPARSEILTLCEVEVFVD